MTADPTPTLELPTRPFATSWLNVSLAMGNDVTMPNLYRTVQVEWFDTGVWLTSTDSALLLRSWIGKDVPPDPDEAATVAVSVIDIDKRMIALMKYLLKNAAALEKEDIPVPPVRVAMVSADDTGPQPTLGPELDRPRLVVSTESELLALDVTGLNFPNVRTLFATHKPNATKQVGIGIEPMAKLAGLRGIDAVHWAFSGAAGSISIEAEAGPAVLSGFLAPWVL